MRYTRRVHNCFNSGWPGVLLVLCVALLIAQLSWPYIAVRRQFPIPETVGIDYFESDTLAKAFAISLPPKYSDVHSWPLVVVLHGNGDRGDDPSIVRAHPLFRQALPAIVAAPQCLPVYSAWKPEAVVDFVQFVASKYHVDSKRIYLVGCSMGGHGTWATAAAYPQRFAAIVPISGWGDPSDVKSMLALPIWAFHGENDTVVPVTETQSMIDAIRRAGGKPRLTIISQQGHGICSDVLGRSDLWQWVFAQHSQ